MAPIQHLQSIADFHRTRQLPPPEHPLLSIVDYAAVQMLPEYMDCKWVFDFYFIALKKGVDGKIRYGQQSYDFDEGVMFFIAPGQVFGVNKSPDPPAAEKSGWMLLVHPDFFWNTPFAKTVRAYEYFGYAIHEALFVSRKEEEILWDILCNIRRESQANLDAFSQGIILSQLETLLQYSERFYHRQFLTRKRTGHQLLDKLEALCAAWFDGGGPGGAGLPTVLHFAEQLHVSPRYLTTLLKTLTGQTMQQLLHEKLIERAKEKLSTTTLSVSEIAYELGFEHPQSFSKLFKNKTELSPVDFRKSFYTN